MFGGHNCNGFEVIQLYPKIYLEKFFSHREEYVNILSLPWKPSLTAMFFKICIFFAMVFILQLIEYCFLKFMMNVYFWLKRYAPN